MLHKNIKSVSLEAMYDAGFHVEEAGDRMRIKNDLYFKYNIYIPKYKSSVGHTWVKAKDFNSTKK